MYNLIYIASNGRSGSTLLDIILGAHESCWTAGEAQILSHELRQPTQTCGCGQMVDQCPVWKRVADDCRDAVFSPAFDWFREKMGAGKVVRPREILGMLLLKRTTAPCAYTQVNEQLFRRVAEEAAVEKGPEVDHLVDASKDAYRLAAFAADLPVPVKAVHLMKDPRAFVYSMVKKDRGARRFFKALRMSFRYVVENLVIELACRGLPDNRKMRLRYEDLASDPQGSLDRICDTFGLKRDADAVKRFRETQHGISGNRSRMEDRPIVLDTKWKTELPASLRLIAYLIALPAALRYGYGL